MTHRKPDILSCDVVAKTRFFCVESVGLRFSNGEERVFERLKARGGGAIMVVPMLDDDTVLLVREYGVGLETYYLSFPKGFCEEGEDLFETANRELQEEVGYAAGSFELLADLTSSPGYSQGTMPIVLARDLVPQTAEGDEPEPLEIVPWSIKDYKALLAHDEFHEARSVAATFLLRERFS